MFFLSDAGDVPLTAQVADQSTAFLFITTQRAVGLALVLLASWLAAGTIGRLGTGKSTTSLSIAAYITLLLAVVGCWLFIGIDSDVGNFKVGGGFPLVLFLTWQRAIGLGLLWVASMSVVGILGGASYPRNPRPSHQPIGHE
jgi:hypothetical protein